MWSNIFDDYTAYVVKDDVKETTESLGHVTVELFKWFLIPVVTEDM